MQNRKIVKGTINILLTILLVGIISTNNTVYASDNTAVGTENQVSLSDKRPIYPADHGSTLAEIVQALCDQDYEFACGFSSEGEKLFEVTSNLPSTVYTTDAIRADFIRCGGTLFIHNHPGNDAFSGQDLRSAATSQFVRTMVIGEDFIYTLEPTKNGWGDPDVMANYWAERRAYYAKYVDDFHEAYRYDAKTLLTTELPPDDGSLLWFYNNSVRNSLVKNPKGPLTVNVGTWISHQVMLDVAERFQMSYYRYVTDEFDATDPRIFLPATSEVQTGIAETDSEVSVTQTEPAEESSKADTAPEATLANKLSATYLLPLAWTFLFI